MGEAGAAGGGEGFYELCVCGGKESGVVGDEEEDRWDRAFLPEDLAETNHLPELSLEYKETWQTVLRAIEAMPAKQQQVFRMSRIEGLTNNEIAERTGLSLSAVKWHIVAGLNTLRMFLAAQGPPVRKGPRTAREKIFNFFKTDLSRRPIRASYSIYRYV
ncbi:RNA polymerase sigma factor [Puia sp. P3]|uniref:RNA polymerase sigma factor n=1 Tax=Puia sp. P3 TaxID=3423952 RepID=UPI003D67635A